MVTKKQSRVPGRPRRFAPEQAISAAKVLFHQKGFDAVSVAEVTDYLGINPPSLYAAFGRKPGVIYGEKSSRHQHLHYCFANLGWCTHCAQRFMHFPRIKHNKITFIKDNCFLINAFRQK